MSAHGIVGNVPEGSTFRDLRKHPAGLTVERMIHQRVIHPRMICQSVSDVAKRSCAFSDPTLAQRWIEMNASTIIDNMIPRFRRIFTFSQG